MVRYRIRVGLLALGVLLGYGSAIAHFTGHAHHRHHGPCGWYE